MFWTGAADKKSFLTHTYTHSTRGPLGLQRPVYCTSATPQHQVPQGGGRRGGGRVEMEMVSRGRGGRDHGDEKEREIKLEVEGRNEEN